ncbi:hypothetical protein IG197_27740 [Aminobacter sp. SR38]|jgi:hypothetical protein|uniref:hypothetical protein n=1 Tax=Aminobacter sp. SR38 TaxID=2774562 RepID=UPI00177F5421|nr:hypothetical protein [Aminobacter sp. SR38]QOF74430.1 hypothetical protein IG197_27740 [Aminobacter sp. SR38]
MDRSKFYAALRERSSGVFGASLSKWRKATFISRDHPYLWVLSIELGLSDAVVDELLIAAAKI